MMRGLKAQLHAAKRPPVEVEEVDTAHQVTTGGSMALALQKKAVSVEENRHDAMREFFVAAELFTKNPPKNLEDRFRQILVIEAHLRLNQIFPSDTIMNVIVGLREFAQDPIGDEIACLFAGNNRAIGMRPQGRSHDPVWIERGGMNEETGHLEIDDELVDSEAGNCHIVTRPRDAGMTGWQRDGHLTSPRDHRGKFIKKSNTSPEERS